MLVLERTTQEHLEYLPVTQKFLTGKQAHHPEGLTSERLPHYRERKENQEIICNVSCNNPEVGKTVHQVIFDRKVDGWSIEVKGLYAFVNDLHAEDSG